MEKDNNYFMGVEISTQQVKAVVIDDNLAVVAQDCLVFDSELPEFKTSDGVHRSKDGLTVTSPVHMWIQGIQMVIEKLKKQNVDFSRIVALSGDGQQHGSVYWKAGSGEVLSTLDPTQTLDEQLKDCFSISDCPIWMDSSTTTQCQRLEASVGGPLGLAQLTGSRGYERFTGNQVMKIYEERPDVYNLTERISLVSSFGASLFIGDYSPIDWSDGSGMNLLDIHRKEWDKRCVKVCGGDALSDKLAAPVASTQIVGTISSYFIKRYNFNPNCKVVAFTGDNPASLAGMMLSPGDLVMSLGTSDTLFLWLSEPRPQLDGHVFINPVKCDEYMALLCFKNGSLTRDRVKKELCDDSWSRFGEMLGSEPVGNSGNMGIYFDVMEITPAAVGCYRMNSRDENVSSFSPSVEVRSCIEGQIMAKRVHAENVGFKLGCGGKILATGGASANQDILQVVADVFHMPVYTSLTSANSACLGCAYRALHAYEMSVRVSGAKPVAFEECLRQKCDSIIEKGFSLAATPRPEYRDVYQKLCARYKVMEQGVMR